MTNLRSPFTSILIGICITLVFSIADWTFAQTDPNPDPNDNTDNTANTANDTQPQPNPADIELSPVVRRLLEDDFTSTAERRQLALFHGQWDNLTGLSIAEQAELSLARYELDDPSLQDESVNVHIRAEAAIERGEPDKAVRLLEDAVMTPGLLLKARAHEQLGDYPAALATLLPISERLLNDTIEDPADLTAGAQAIVMLGRLEGRPAQDYTAAISILSRTHEVVDRLYWPAHLAEARLLLDKDNRAEAVRAILDTLSLNPKCGEAWYLIGKMAAESFDFERASLAVQQLIAINKDHPLARKLQIESYLIQRDTASALPIVTTTLERFPTHRDFWALLAATHALRYDEPAMKAAFERFEELAPRSADAYLVVGAHLATARQYDASEKMLREAMSRQPNWAEPRIELGLMLMQAGREAAALEALRRAQQLDPFNRRVRNTLALAEDLQDYQRIETEHFIIKWTAEIDEALARDMPDVLEQIYDEVTLAFDHKPANKTHIEILPDAQHFAVRITGLPELWTIAACTGDVIAITPPRIGAGQKGNYDWANVIKHEYTHTVTLSKTRYRIPHWFTEACAVSQERIRRDYNTARLLAAALHGDELFDLAQVNWAFVRPKRPADRSLAYAQSDWMLEYVTVRFGHRAVLALLDRFATGQDGVEAMAHVTGLDSDAFLAGFKEWAAAEVTSWGLDLRPDDPRLSVLDSQDVTITEDRLHELIDAFPREPRLLRLAAERALDRGELDDAWAAILRYAASRPVDPWPHHQLVRLALATDRLTDAIGSLEELDRMETESGQWAIHLARAYRSMNEFALAGDAIDRALQREPYHAPYRELAAAIEIQRGHLPGALRHIRALTVIEPHRARHFSRLAAVYTRLGDNEAAKQATEKAAAINANNTPR